MSKESTDAILRALKLDPECSNGIMARNFKVSIGVVARIREKAVIIGELPITEKRRFSDNSFRTVSQKSHYFGTQAEQVKAIRSMLAGGNSLAQIASALKIPPYAVRVLIKHYRITAAASVMEKKTGRLPTKRIIEEAVNMMEATAASLQIIKFTALGGLVEADLAAAAEAALKDLRVFTLKLKEVAHESAIATTTEPQLDSNGCAAGADEGVGASAARVSSVSRR